MGDNCFIIAEAGVNHNGDEKLAEELVDAAGKAGADAVKFQTWTAGEQTGRFAFKVDYLKKTTDKDISLYETLEGLRLSFDAFRRLQRRAGEIDVIFLSTPDGQESLDFVADELDVPYIKVGSSEVTHHEFLEAIGRKGRPVFLSTGLSNLGEVEKAIRAIEKGGPVPVTLLHCTSEYPAAANEMNLRAMETLRSAFSLPVGLSDHSTGHEAAIAAVALGAAVIEKHFTLDRNLPGPDHKASIDPSGLKGLVRSIRTTEKMLGDGTKRATKSELKNMAGIRRSVVASSFLKSGTCLTRDQLACKRPGNGIQPEHLETLIGMTVTRDVQEDEPLFWQDVKS